jgi:hypothetical protein
LKVSASGTDGGLVRSIVLIVRLQVFTGLILVGATWLWSEPASAMAAAFGAALGVLGTLVSARGVWRTGNGPGAKGVPSLAPIYLGALQKLLIVAVGVTFGLVVLDLDAMFLLIGLILSQFGYLVASIWSLAGDR